MFCVCHIKCKSMFSERDIKIALPHPADLNDNIQKH